MIECVTNLLQIILIDLSMAGDNALVVGLAVASLPPKRRKKAMLWGIGMATILRIVMAFFAVQLLHVTGLMLAGGLLLAWVAWKLLREIHAVPTKAPTHKATNSEKFSAAVRQIVIADVSMSLDNVLGVAGVAREHMAELVAGLGLSVGMMALASTQIARLTARYPKAAYVGVAVIAYTALRMMIDGIHDLPINLNPWN